MRDQLDPTTVRLEKVSAAAVDLTKVSPHTAAFSGVHLRPGCSWSTTEQLITADAWNGSTIVSVAVLPGVNASLMQQCACIGLVCVLALGVAFNRAGKRRLASDGSSYGLHPTAQARFIASWSESCRLGWLRARWSLQRPSATLSVSMAAWGTAFSPYPMT